MDRHSVPANGTEDEDARRRRVLGLAAAALLVAALVVGVLIAVSQSGGDDSGGGTEAAAIDSLPQEGAVIGDPEAEVKLIEYADLQCPFCAEFAADVTPELIEGPVADGEASLEYRNWVIIGPDSIDAATAALAAGEQDRLWQFVDAFYRRQGAENSGYVTDDFLLGIAEDAGVPDIEQWQSDRRDPALESELRAVGREAQQLGLTGTPSVVVEGPDGEQQVVDDLSVEGIEAAIDAAAGG